MSAATDPAQALPIVEDGAPRAVIVVRAAAGEATTFAAAELQRYLQALSGATVEVVTDAQLEGRPETEAWILIGGPKQNGAVQRAVAEGVTGFDGLAADGFLLKSCRLGARPAMVAGGNDEAATMYAVFELVEQLGVTFRLTGDFIPERRPSLAIPPLDLRKEPSFPRRGFLLQIGGYESMTMFSFADYARLLDQMAKMKCNYLVFWWFAYEPWLKFSYRGESMWMGDVATKESGYMNWVYQGFGSRTTDDVSIGAQQFPARRLAPPEFQEVETPDEAFAAAQSILSRLIRHARSRHINVWPAIELHALPPNLARHCERVGDLPFNRVFGTFTHPLDPVNREIQVNRLQALIETYPEAEGYFLVFPEEYPNLNTEKHRAFFDEQAPKFQELRRLRLPWRDWLRSTADRAVESNAALLDLFQYLLARRDAIAPAVKLGIMGIGRGYTLPLFDTLLPKDVPFTDMESSGVWTPGGVPMHYWGAMGERERTIQPRVDDDAHMMGMQFNVTQYALQDRMFVDGVRVGLSGHAAQINRARGTEANSTFLAQAAWEPQLTPQDFYRRYATRLFGPDAATAMYDALLTLEAHEQHLGYTLFATPTLGCCGPMAEVRVVYQYSLQENPFDGATGANWRAFLLRAPAAIARFIGAIALLDTALEHMRAAVPTVAAHGRYELAYMLNRTETYRDHIRALILMRQALHAFDGAFRRRNKVPYDQFVAALAESLTPAEAALRQTRAATAAYAELIDHPSDLGVLYHLNVRMVLGYDLVCQWLQKIVCFHQGRPYTQHVAFERLFPTDVRNAGEK